MMKKLLTALLLAALTLLLASPAQAVPSTFQITLTGTTSYGAAVELDVTNDYGGPVTIAVDCYQGDAYVYSAGSHDVNTYGSQDYTLSSTYWTGGSAECVATASRWKFSRPHVVDTLAFAVTG